METRSVATYLKPLAFLLLVLIPELALAEPWDDWGDKVLGVLQSPLVTTVATIVIIALGIAALIGQLTWKAAGSWMLGMVIVFGGPQIVAFFS